MNLISTPLQDCYVIEPQVFGDNRGYFYESFNEKKFNDAIKRNVSFVQDNQSKSTYGILRGLHYQTTQTQGKLVRVVQGEVFDVAVDMRKNSKTFGHSYGLLLSEENRKMFWIPEGFAHGFLVTSPEAVFLYKTTDYYHPQSEVSLLWNDQQLNINWPKINIPPLLKEKDAHGLLFNQCPYF
ncbi:MAG: dTDP-4-dehydrorhamnose 3,5-epimerase [Pseudobdellovibrio sp.]